MADLVSSDTLYSSVVPTLFALAGIGLFRILFVAPFRIYREARASSSALTLEVSNLREERRPKIAIVRNGSSHPWRQNQRSLINDKGEPGYLYTYRIGLTNTGMETVNGVRVRLEEINERPYDLLAVPCSLIFMNHETNDISGTHDPILIDVFCYFLGDRGTKRMWICHGIDTANRVIPTRNYEVRLSVGSSNGGLYFSEWWSIKQTDALPEFELIRKHEI